MTSDVEPTDAWRDTAPTGVRAVSGTWWWLLILGILWIWFGMFVLSYRAGSLAAVAAVAAVVGVAFLFGGVSQLVIASRARAGAGCTS